MTLIDIIKKLLYKFLMHKRLDGVKQLERLLSECPDRASVETYQVSLFNKIWHDAYTNVPFYQGWMKKYGLPSKIECLDELAKWPILTKADLRESKLFARLNGSAPVGVCMTGGSTGEPVRIPSWKDDGEAGVSQAYGRKAYGVGLGDKTFLLWGHEHLYGKGFKRKINTIKRRFKDWLAGWIRVSAYDLGADAMHEAYKSFAKFKPKFIIGFSAAVLAFVRQNVSKKGEINSVEVILCTAGPLTTDERNEIESFFGGKVCMEYGSVECAIMAYTRPSAGEYDVFWNTHLLQAVKQSNGEYKNARARSQRNTWALSCCLPAA